MSAVTDRSPSRAASRIAAIGRRGGRPLRFLVAGAVNTLLGLAFYPMLLWASPWFRVHYLAALGLAQITCLLFAFATHKFGVFRTRGPGIVRELAAFASFYAISYAANWAMLPLLVELAGIRPAAAQTGFTLAVIAGSYFWHSRITFRPADNPEQPRSQEIRCEP
ncbi:hypothetical protein G432_10860 [Sphingomonas sp. MM-1]|uniref:GtrA-like protein n=1 Tax=Edaphosphingomonas haloaromaticamans TaxID=653954 RepID=A0A1S1HA64_9SPHN|nr:GtrA family protein [Sphingomonas sp. MM-1]AGH49895.1 hypothetical protein G432_10860 [Sphingomonas sp. MM-1]OHT18213.1 GtrA-like protein [Sphingomonas haloaromaticamans]